MVTFYPSVRESSVCLRSLVHLIQIVRKAATCAMVLVLPQSQRQRTQKHSCKVMYQGFNRLNVSPKAIPQNQARALQEHLLPCPPHALEGSTGCNFLSGTSLCIVFWKVYGRILLNGNNITMLLDWQVQQAFAACF